VFETCVWIGRFIEAWARFADVLSHGPRLVYRKDVKLRLCGTVKAKDPNVRQALLDLYGGENKAIGGKKCQQCKGKKWIGPRAHDVPQL
jgi:hypothetical protein